MHGGALGSGAPAGQRNGAYRHGGATQQARARMREMRAWLRVARAGLDELE